MKSAGVCHIRGIEDLTNHAEHNICLRVHYLALHSEECTVFIDRVCAVKHFHAAHDPACLGIDLI